MRATILIDNNPHPGGKHLTEHGLSMYFEADGYKWLIDVGASAQFYTNAASMGIAIEDVDYLILSHGHADHTGGLERFVEVNKKARVLLSAHIEGRQWYSYRRQTRRKSSIDHEVVAQNASRFTRIDGNTPITEHVTLICNIPRVFEAPRANSKLTQTSPEGESLDDFKHEMALLVDAPGGAVVFSGCSHNGVLNILEASSQYIGHRHIHACIGGTHLLDSDSTNANETDAQIRAIATSIDTLYPRMKLITGHCTGTNAQAILAGVLGHRYATFFSGAVFDV